MVRPVIDVYVNADGHYEHQQNPDYSPFGGHFFPFTSLTI